LIQGDGGVDKNGPPEFRHAREDGAELGRVQGLAVKIRIELQAAEFQASTTLSVRLVGLQMLRHQALTPVLSRFTNAVFPGFLTQWGCLRSPAPDIYPLKNQ